MESDTNQTEQVISEEPDKLRGRETPDRDEPGGGKFYLVCLTSLGVVFGDIGTSPLYALRECFSSHNGLQPTPDNILGILSLIFWSLNLVISVKYLLYVMRADNEGEGGILALMALVGRRSEQKDGLRRLLVVLGIFGAALLYGDGMLTPAISVLSAVEGLNAATPALSSFVLPITCFILVGLFIFQRRGTGGVGAVFGPAMLIWFITLAILGVAGIMQQPRVLAAILPTHAISFFIHAGWKGFLVLGAVFLVITGGEALYADMGHFTRRTIRITWFGLVLPSLLLNYFGQGAMLLDGQVTIGHLFYRLAPSWALYPMVILATSATVIASQAVISASFSLTRQAAFLALFPRVHIVQTSSKQIGQIYVPIVNWLLMASTIGLVLTFRQSGRLAGAYGVAVSTTMVITTLLIYTVSRRRWKWSRFAAVTVTMGLLVVDLAFFGANLFRIVEGGWFPLLVGFLVVLLMTTWKRGRMIQSERLKKAEFPFDGFMEKISRKPPARVPGTAVFMSGNPSGTPPILLHHLKHNQVLHEKVILLTVTIDDVPRLWWANRLEITDLGHGFLRILMHFGFMESCRVPEALQENQADGRPLVEGEVTYYVGEMTVIPAGKKPGMAVWREVLYAFMARNSARSVAFYSLPSQSVMGVGIEVEL